MNLYKLSISLNIILMFIIVFMIIQFLLTDNSLEKDPDIECSTKEVSYISDTSFNAKVLCGSDDYELYIWMSTSTKNNTTEIRLNVKPADNKSYYIYVHDQFISDDKFGVAVSIDGYSPIELEYNFE